MFNYSDKKESTDKKEENKDDKKDDKDVDAKFYCLLGHLNLLLENYPKGNDSHFPVVVNRCQLINQD